MNRIGYAVELRGVAAVPKCVHGVFFTGGVEGFEILRHDGVSAAGAGESGNLGEAAELDGDFTCPFDLVDRMRHFGIANECFVGGIEEDDGLILLGVSNPFGELRFGGDSSGRIVGEAEIDQIGRVVWDRRDVTIIRRAFEVSDALIATINIAAGATSHDVGVGVNRIHGIGNREGRIFREDFLDVGAIALRTVGNKDFISRDVAAAGCVIIGRDSVSEEAVTLLWAVAFEGSAVSHFVGRGVESCDADRRERFGDISDAELDDRLVGIGLDEIIHALGDVGEEVGSFELGVVLVNLGHENKDAGADFPFFARWALKDSLSNWMRRSVILEQTAEMGLVQARR